MQKQDCETVSEWLNRLSVIAKNLTQEQIDACAYVMGASGCGWTLTSLSDSLDEESRKANRLDRY